LTRIDFETLNSSGDFRNYYINETLWHDSLLCIYSCLLRIDKSAVQYARLLENHTLLQKHTSWLFSHHEECHKLSRPSICTHLQRDLHWVRMFHDSSCIRTFHCDISEMFQSFDKQDSSCRWHLKECRC